MRRVVAARAGARLALVFGSLARGSLRRESDVDVAVDLGHPLTVDETLEVTAALALATGRAVDLVDLRTVGEPLLGQIVRHGRRILGGEAAHASLISRHLIDAADFMPIRDRLLAERRQAWIGR
ncbi:MAG: nucleotidyltransferase domain-containing protein [Chloroflexota bacterium]|nr:MAG: nucleotidyltransferase domain-containing protein [Chloroflexota bacterium]